jgi:MYXO-CTERM domain-containing protein
MLLTALSAFVCAWASGPIVERTAGHPPIDTRQPALTSLIPAHGFDEIKVRTRSASFGQTLHLYGVYRSVPTHAPVAVIRLDDENRPRLLSHSLLPVEPPPSSTLAEAELAARVGQATGRRPDLIGPIRLRVIGSSYRAVRALSYDHPLQGMVRPTFLVDPASGRILERFDATFDGPGHSPDGDKVPSALVYPIDPLLTPDLIDVELPESTRYGLVSEHFSIHNCVDLGETYSANTELGTVELRMCTERAPLPPDGGQWRFTPVPYPEDTALDEDDFAGPQLLWHGEQTIDALMELGLPLDERPLEWQRLTTLSNARLTDLSSEETMSDPSSPLSPYDNAYFRRGRETSDDRLVPPELVFGQGTVGDFAYDVDVIIHEIGHFAVWTQGGPSYTRSTIHGSSAEPGALNEGLADYFAAIFTGDPVVGTYSGDALGRSYIRTLSGDARCPDALMGQVHADSQPFSQALWSFRTTLAAPDQTTLDGAIVDALPAIGARGGFAAAVESIVAEVELQLSAEDATALAAEFSRRSVDACIPHVPVPVSGLEARSYTLVPAFYADSYDQPIPGYVQFVIEEDGPIDVSVDFIQTRSTEVDLWGTNDPRDVAVLFKSGGPIVHDGYYDDDLERWVWSHNADGVGSAVRTTDLGTNFDGTEIEYGYTAELRLEGSGPHYLQLANEFQRSVTARGMVFTWSDTEGVEDTAAPTAATPAATPRKSSGCSCTTAAPERGPGWLLGALFLGLGLVGSRRRPRAR